MINTVELPTPEASEPRKPPNALDFERTLFYQPPPTEPKFINRNQASNVQHMAISSQEPKKERQKESADINLQNFDPIQNPENAVPC